ncbi:MAG: hypothetical protein WCI57_02830 [Candidatus Berkelbacteria bacterium]
MGIKKSGRPMEEKQAEQKRRQFKAAPWRYNVKVQNFIQKLWRKER